MILLFWISAPKFNRRCSCKILQEHLLLCFGFTKHKQRSSVNVLKEVLLNRSRWLGSKYIGKLLLYHIIRHNYFQNLIQLQFITRSRLQNNSCWVLAVPIHLRCEKTNFFLLDTYNFKLVIQFIKNVSTGAHDSVSL